MGGDEGTLNHQDAIVEEPLMKRSQSIESADNQGEGKRKILLVHNTTSQSIENSG